MLHLGDALDVLPTLPAESVDAVVTDPPAGIGFMGSTWDKPEGMYLSDGRIRTGVMPVDATSTRNPSCRRCRGRLRAGPKTKNPCVCEVPDLDIAEGQIRGREAFIAFLAAAMAECLRVARPGAYALVWALPRTSHWTATAIEDAGWVVQDKIYHMFGTGFPKHKSKLKPACEEWILAWKPDRKATPLQIDACRIGTDDDRARPPRTPNGIYGDGAGTNLTASDSHPAGRWPANVVLSHIGGPDGCREVGTRRVRGKIGGSPRKPSPLGQVGGLYRWGDRSDLTWEELPENAREWYERAAGVDFGYADADGTEAVPALECVDACPVRQLDEQSGESKSRATPADSRPGRSSNGYGPGDEDGWDGTWHRSGVHYGDSGGASRFYYTPKAPRSERWSYCRDCGAAVPPSARADHAHGHADGKHLVGHPTQKSLALMAWLMRLITPPGGTVLDPFAGSGSTGEAAALEGFGFIGIERDEEYHRIAERRIEAVRRDFPLFSGSPR